VSSFLQFYGLNGEDILNVKILKPNLDARKKAAFEHDITVRQVFTELLDVFGRPSRRFWETLPRFATDAKEKEALKHILSAEGKDEMKKLVEETVTCADVLRKYPSAHPSLEHLIDLIGVIKPRYYTIASAQKMYANMLHLMIVIVDWKTPSKKLKFGTCTGYVNRMIPTTEHPVRFACAVKPGTFTLPESDETPMVMAGLGTGLAPFRAFVQYRAVLKKEGKPAGPMIMYYGCRYRKRDYIYADEWESYEKEGVLTAVRVAFSRDQAHKIYIQHKISEDPKLIWEHLFAKGGYFYLCGQAGQMPIDIKNAIIGAMKSEGHMSADEAEKAFQALQIAGRYNLEVY
jgi:sulfite reductase (NADPH) flavoprotein alpha-component